MSKWLTIMEALRIKRKANISNEQADNRLIVFEKNPMIIDKHI